MENQYKIQIVDSPFSLGVDIFLYFKRHDGKIFISRDGNKFEEEVIPGEVIKPTLFLSSDIMQDLFDALQRKGLKPREQSKTEGLYEAQTEHLKDMRTLLKLK